MSGNQPSPSIASGWVFAVLAGGRCRCAHGVCTARSPLWVARRMRPGKAVTVQRRPSTAGVASIGGRGDSGPPVGRRQTSTRPRSRPGNTAAPTRLTMAGVHLKLLSGQPAGAARGARMQTTEISQLRTLEAEAIHVMRGRPQSSSAPCSVLRRQGLDRAAAARREGVPAGAVPVSAHAHRHRPQLPRGDRVPRPPGGRTGRAARRRERAGVDRQGPRRRADRAGRLAQRRCRR